jgi:hypothetical protein
MFLYFIKTMTRIFFRKIKWLFEVPSFQSKNIVETTLSLSLTEKKMLSVRKSKRNYALIRSFFCGVGLKPP